MNTPKNINRQYKGLIVILTSLVLLQGCATMDESDCLSADWNQIGFRDGSRGLETSMMDSRASDCQKHNIGIDRNRYLSGHTEGLNDFCVASNGYRKGIEKVEYNYVCPANSEGPFLQEYIRGLNVSLDQVIYDLREIQFDIREAELDLRDAETEDEHKRTNKRLNYLESSRNSLDIEDREIRQWLNIAIGRF